MNDMKVIALIPVKNESWVLNFSLKNLSLFSDEIIILDDSSTDDSLQIAQSFAKVSVIKYKQTSNTVNMSDRRNILLDAGRKSEGTHFIFLDADETLSLPFLETYRNHFQKMSPGDVLCLPWVLVFAKDTQLFFDKDKALYKNFIFCDDRKTKFKDISISEERTPYGNGTLTNVPFEEGYVLHFQQLAYTRNQYKQIWYKCNELIGGKRPAKRINATYDFTKTPTLDNPTEIIEQFYENNKSAIEPNKGEREPLERINTLFEKYGIEYFEKLDIWYLPEMGAKFKQLVGRAPEIDVYPRSILILNGYKNRLKNSLSALKRKLYR